MTKVIGEDATHASGVKPQAYFSTFFDRLKLVGDAYSLAEQVRSDAHPLLSVPVPIASQRQDGVTLVDLSTARLSDRHNLSLYVGDPDSWFFQVPLLKVADGIDVVVTGDIDDKGQPRKLVHPKKLTDLLAEYPIASNAVNLGNPNRVLAVALVPVGADLGNQLYISAASDKPYTGRRSYYGMGVNGFLVRRNIVSHDGTPTCLMFPGEEGKERYLKLSEVLGGKELRDLASQGVFPGLTLIVGEYSKEDGSKGYDIVKISLHGSVDKEPGISNILASGEKGGVIRRVKRSGEMALEVGDESSVRYDKTTGRRIGVEGILSVKFIPVTPNTTPAQVIEEIKKYIH